MASQHPKMSKQGTAGKRKCVNCMIPQKLEIIRRHDSGKRQREVVASYDTGSSSIYYIKKWKDQL
jgi:hypothetical protein